MSFKRLKKTASFDSFTQDFGKYQIGWHSESSRIFSKNGRRDLEKPVFNV